jgi:flagellar basal-body rod protein FlgG
MLEGLYSAATGMEAQQQRLEAVSNDVSNVNTDGYKSERTGFHDLLYSRESPFAANGVLAGAGAASSSLGFNWSEGALRLTGQPLDVAVNGAGFLEVRRADGSTGLIRGGSLSIDASGRLVTGLGQLVQPPVTVPRGTRLDQISISPNGTVSVAGRAVGRLALVNVPSPNGLQPSGEGTYTATAASGAPGAATGATLQQGALEGSNVDIAQSVTDMMDAQHAYQLDGESVQIINSMAQIANSLRS